MPPGSADRAERSAAGGTDTTPQADQATPGQETHAHLLQVWRRVLPTANLERHQVLRLRWWRMRAKSCVVCGRRTPDGASRCLAHKNGTGRLRGCLVCGRPGPTNYCELHSPEIDEAERNARNPYRKAYKDPQYATNRRHRFERARGRCEYCGTPLMPGDWECDHAVALKDGGTNDVSNLRVVCKPCHRRKTRQERNSRK